MTMTVSPAAQPPEDATFKAGSTPRVWLGWSVAAAGFAALALSFVVSLGQARAEQAVIGGAQAFALVDSAF